MTGRTTFTGRSAKAIEGVHAFAPRGRMAAPEVTAVAVGFLILLAVVL
jgi:hypothetical protein